MKQSLKQMHDEFEKRFVRLKYLDDNFGFILNTQQMLYEKSDTLQAHCLNFSKIYAIDVDGDSLYRDIVDIQSLVESRPRIVTLLELLNFIVKYGQKEVFPSLFTAIQIMLTISVSIASCERSFSKLKLNNVATKAKWPNAA